MRISDWSSDVCSSDLAQVLEVAVGDLVEVRIRLHRAQQVRLCGRQVATQQRDETDIVEGAAGVLAADAEQCPLVLAGPGKGEAQVLARRFQLRVELQGPVEVDDRRLGLPPPPVGEAAVIVAHRVPAVYTERPALTHAPLDPLAPQCLTTA